VTSEPLISERVLVVEIDRSASQPEAGDDLEKLVAHVKENSDGRENGDAATLTLLDGSRSHAGLAPSASAADLSGTYVFRATSKEHSDAFERQLRNHSRVGGRVYRPPAYRTAPVDKTAARPRPAAAPALVPSYDIADKLAEADAVVQWGLTRCGFPEVWDKLTGEDPGPIVMIDNGSHLGHRELHGVIDYTGPGKIGQASIADHASSVAAVMCARRGESKPAGAQDMDGCCPAKIELFNVWTKNHGVDHALLYNALTHAINNRRPVVNISIWLQGKDHYLERLLTQCEDNHVFVVAAIGNVGNGATSFYPATDPHVVAVAATDPADQHYVDSITGREAFIAAPGENIFTVVGDSDYDRLTGTSFAAPFVSAAAWLAKRKRSGLTNNQVRWVLSQCVAQPGQGRNSIVGYGRLDVRHMAEHLKRVPSNDECARHLAADLPLASAG